MRKVTEDDIRNAREYYQAAKQLADEGKLFVGEVRIRVITRSNADAVFAPYVAALVKRVMWPRTTDV